MDTGIVHLKQEDVNVIVDSLEDLAASAKMIFMGLSAIFVCFILTDSYFTHLV